MIINENCIFYFIFFRFDRKFSGAGKRGRYIDFECAIQLIRTSHTDAPTHLKISTTSQQEYYYESKTLHFVHCVLTDKYTYSHPSPQSVVASCVVFILHTITHTYQHKVLSFLGGVRAIPLNSPFEFRRRCLSHSVSSSFVYVYNVKIQSHAHTHYVPVFEVLHSVHFSSPNITYRNFTSISFLCFSFLFGFGF